MTSRRDDRHDRLRKRAEAILATGSGGEAAATPEDYRALIHDLSVHRIELELQNEELQQAQQEAERIRDSYIRLYHRAPVGYLTLTPQGIIVQHNRTFAEMIGTTDDRVRGTALAEFLVPEDRELLLGRYRPLFRNPEGKSLEVRLQRQGGKAFWARLTARKTDDIPAPAENPPDSPGLLVIVADINEQKAAETALNDRSAFIATLMDTIPTPLFYKDTNGRYLGCNRAFASFIGTSPEELAGKTVHDVAPVDLAAMYESHDRQLLNSGGSEAYPCQTYRADGALREVIFNKAVFPDASGSVAGIIGAITDVTDLKREAAELERSRAELQAIYEHAPVMMCLLDENRSVLYANLALAEYAGLPSSGLQSGQVCDIIGCIHALDDSRGCGYGPRCQDCSLWLAMADSLSTGASHRNIEYRTPLKHLDTTREVVLLGDTALIRGGGRNRLLFCLQDITDRVLAEEAVRRSLQEKEVLLGEIHHRVKNNLQLISSLINLQSYGMRDQQVMDVFQQSQNRIRAIALVHEKLYRSQDFTEIDFHDFLNDLVAILYRSYGMIRNITLDITVDQGILLRMDEANPCGLIVTELFSNSLKYAFPGDRPGKVVIEMSRQNGRTILCVRDDGVGLPQAFDPYQTDTLGYQLITSLAQQIGGALSIDTTIGTEVCVSWPHAPQPESAPPTPSSFSV